MRQPQVCCGGLAAGPARVQIEEKGEQPQREAQVALFAVDDKRLRRRVVALLQVLVAGNDQTPASAFESRPEKQVRCFPHVADIDTDLSTTSS